MHDCMHLACSWLARMQAPGRVSSMYTRVRKHLGPSGLALRVWARLYEDLLAR